ncbi:UNVERIFIED_CONTAM: hypothetical protein Sindi_2857200, partial [Sesamum indicum]
MLQQRLKKAVTDNPKKVADLIDLVNLPTVLRDFMGQSQSSRLNVLGGFGLISRRTISQ